MFMATSEDVSKEAVKAPPLVELPYPTNLNPPSYPQKVEPVISLNALVGFSTPQTLKIIGYIKHRMVIILIDS
jgi:hypothetical protein